MNEKPAHEVSILAVEDEAGDFGLIRAHLRLAGYGADMAHDTVSWAQSLSEAEGILAAHQPDIVLLDLSLPDSSGLATVVRMRKLLPRVPIIVLSGNTNKEIAIAALEEGAQDYVVKGHYEHEALGKAVSHALVRAKLEARLHDSEFRWKFAIEGSGDGLWDWNVAESTVFFSKRWKDMLGYAEEEVQNGLDEWEQRVHPDDQAATRAAVQAHLEDKTPIYQSEHRVRCKNGEYKWILDRGMVVSRDAEGKPLRLIGTYSDISARKENQRKQELLLAIIEAAPQFIGTATPEGRVTHLNPAGLKIMNFAPGFDVTTTRISDYHPEWVCKILQEQALVTAARAGIWNGETVLLSRDGKEIAIAQTILSHRGSDGAIEQYSTIASDISKNQQLQEEAVALREHILQATKMDSIGHLTAGIAHDFNNILGAMLGYAELSKLILNSKQVASPEKLNGYLDMILSSGNRAKELILQMLTFSRASKNSAAGMNAPVILLTPVIKEVVSLLRASIPSTIALNYRVESDDLKARIQAIQLHQILFNLCVNARDAMGEYGKLEISLDRYQSEHQICASCKNGFAGNYIRLTVKDSGSGIPKKNLHNIFDPFFTTKGVGKGMGLSVVHGLVHGANGHIQVESIEGAGTEMSILLPADTLSEVTAPEAGVPMPLAGIIGGARILLVDDELALLYMMQEFLAAKGARISAYSDARLALEAYTKNPDNFDLVITDETMPGLSGMHMAESMLRIRPGVPIILCTGYSERVSAEAATAAGLSGFLFKPLNMNELLQKIEAIVKAKKEPQNEVASAPGH